MLHHWITFGFVKVQKRNLKSVNMVCSLDHWIMKIDSKATLKKEKTTKSWGEKECQYFLGAN